MKPALRLIAVLAILGGLFWLGLRQGRQTKAAEASRPKAEPGADASDRGSAGSPNHKADQEAIEAILKAQQDAWNRGDIEAFVVGYWHSPELTFSGASGVSRGWDGVLARYKKNYPDRATMGHLDFSGLEFHFLGADGALVLGNYHLTREKGDASGVFSLVWERFPEGWKIIHDHTSAVEKK